MANNYKSLEQVAEALAKGDLVNSNLIVGIDFSISNTWTGENSFNGKSLHQIGGDANNPYEQVLLLIRRTLDPYMKNKLVHCFGFGDASTNDQDVFSFREDMLPCNGLLEGLAQYRDIAPKLKLAGPTSYAAIIEMAMAIVGRSGGKHHVLLIISDSELTRDSGIASDKLSWYEKETVSAIAKAREYPLSVILVGVGDRSPSTTFSCPLCAFDNFKFVNFTEIMSEDVHFSRKEIEFALAAFMEISKTRNTHKRKLSLSSWQKVGLGRFPLPPPVHGSTSPAMHNESGRCFDSLEHESPINMISGYQGVIQIGNFPVPSSYEALYKKIWEKQGHIATRNVIKTSTRTLATLVAELLKSVAAMETVKRDKLSASLLDKWDRQIEDAEALQFNVQWLRWHFEKVKRGWEADSRLMKSQLTREKEKAVALEKRSAARVKRDALKAQLLEVEKEVEQATSEIKQHDRAISTCVMSREQCASFLQKSFLEDAL
ncbi:hypothetical protein MKW94_026370 [Papaver nudicaule]|uniref:Copine C-terminal domain-containing protein n=1 Tax=Papaver nudicaule TaxID=74823 RepID=A0AA41W0K4_PAPNU|nr:hypothetical protein [Papaver nudicaule]